MRVDNEKELEMNKYEKMSYELIEEKKKVKLDLEKTYIISFGFFMVLSMIFGMFLRNIELEFVFPAILLGMMVSISSNTFGNDDFYTFRICFLFYSFHFSKSIKSFHFN